MKKLLEALKRWVKLPRAHPTETKCVICGCTDSRGCAPASCGWAYSDVDGRFGLCTKCVDERVCSIGHMVASDVIENRNWWKPKKICPCPLCEAARKETR